VCHKTDVSGLFSYNSRSFAYDSEAFIYFYSDSSRTNSGFSMEYSLSCTNVFEYVGVKEGILDYVFTSPGYPSLVNTKNHPTMCYWSVMLESGRDLAVESLDMDLAGRDDGECNEDTIMIVSGAKDLLMDLNSHRVNSTK